MNLDIASIDVGMLNAILPELDIDLDDTTLVNILMEAKNAPVVRF